MDQMKFQSVAAIHPHWRADLLLQINGDNVAHGNAWSWGKYSLQNDTLIVRWNDYPQDRFLFVGGVYLHESFSGGIIGNFNDFRKIGIAGINIDVAKMEVVIPETNQSVKLRTNTSDGDVFLQVFINKEYVSPYMPKNAKKIVDLGANIGLATIFFCNKYPEAELFAVEPGHENFQLLKYNTSFLRNRVKCEQAAAWHSNGKVKIVDHDNDGSHLGAWGLQVRDDYSSDGTIPSYNLSDMFDQAKFDEVDILKIDIEGAELEVFSLGDRSWIDRVNFICVETHDRFRQGTEHAVRSALADKFFELPQSGENLLFSKK